MMVAHWSMSRTETPPLFRRVDSGKRRAGSISRVASSLAANRWPLARARLRTRENEKSVLAIKLGPKAGCSLEALNFRIPSRVFLYRGHEFPGLPVEPR